MNINTHNTHIVMGFKYHAPTSVAEAVKLLSEYGGDTSALAGGTDLIVRMKDGSHRPKHIVNLKRIMGLAEIKETRESIHMGALTRIRDMEKSELIGKRLPVLQEAARTLGSVQIRNLATLGGNLCNASPCADTAVALLAYDAVAHIAGPSGDRAVPLDGFFKGPGATALERGEILTGVSVPKPAKNTVGRWLRVARASMDIATISLAVTVKLKDGVAEDSRFAWGTVAPTPMRTKEVEAYVRSRRLDQACIEEAARLASQSIKPRESGRSRGPYKRRVAHGFVVEALTSLVEAQR
ncbi:MAG: xanthine dehydrogenase family protein subunit M [Candidatus Bathyarchaeota archaeon]